MKIMVGDVGGTHARMAVAEVSRTHCSLVVRREYDSARFDGLAPIVKLFQSEVDERHRPQRACFAVACPVVDGVCVMPNLGWQLDAAHFGADIGLPQTMLINDFDAVAHSLAVLPPDDLVVLQRGTPRPRAPMAVVGAGTGLGVAFLLWDRGRYQVHASEGGHADFGPRTPQDAELFAFLRERFGHVSYERVLAGPGLVHVYDFLRAARAGELTERHASDAEREKAAAEISAAGLAGKDLLASQALDLFAAAYGAFSGNIALALRAEGGVYVGGGIAPRLIDKLTDGTFIRSFRAKGRMSELLERVPVSVIMNEDAGLLGAAVAGLTAAPRPAGRGGGGSAAPD